MKGAFLLAAVAAGIILAGSFPGLLLPVILILLGVLCRITLAVIGNRNPILIPTLSNFHFLWVFFLFSGLGSLSAFYSSPAPGNLPEEFYGKISGRVKQRVTTTRGERYLVDVSHILPAATDAEGNEILKIEENVNSFIKCRNFEVLLFTKSDTILREGDIITYNAYLKKVQEERRSGPLYFTRTTKWGDAPEVTGHSETLFTIASRLRENLKIELENSGLNRESTALLKGLLLADRGEIGKVNIAAFRDAGMSHMLAVSGLHVGIIAALLLWLTKPLNILSFRAIRYMAILISIWVFAFVTGLGYPAMRASLMFSLAIIATLMERQRDGFSNVCIAGMIILVLSPDALYDVGFLLSITCVASLCLFAERLNPVEHHLHPLTYKLCSAALTTIIATGATWMICGYYFKQIPTNFLIANLVILPFLPPYMFVAIIYLIIKILFGEIAILVKVLDFATDMMYRFLDLFAGTSVMVEVDMTSLMLWMTGLAVLAISFYIKPPKMHSGAVVTQAGGEVSLPWLYASLVIFTIAISILAFNNLG